MKGEQIKKLRAAFGLSTIELADLLGVQNSSIYRWEATDRKVAKIEGLAKRLIELMLDLKVKERDTVVKNLRRGGWMAGLSSLLSLSMKKAT